MTSKLLMDTAQGGKSGTNGDSRMDIYILPCVKQIAGEKVLDNTGSPAWCCDDLEGWDEWSGGRLRRSLI